MQVFELTGAAILSVCCPPIVCGQAALNVELSKSFRAELEEIAQVCERVKLTEEASTTRHWLPIQRSDRRVLFLPSAPGKRETNAMVRNWKERFQKARDGFGEQLFLQAQTQANEDEAEAYRMLWQVLRESPGHEGARKILGALARAPMALPRSSRARKDVPELGWAAGSYQRIDAPHFTVLSQADVRKTRQLALELEQFYALWTQMFYELWAPPDFLKARIKDPGFPLPEHERLQVVLLKDRAQYLRVLGVAEDNIGVSVGYYNPHAKMSFYYPAEDLRPTLFHELTHQLLLEATIFEANESAGSAGGIWLLEGIALYMESLQEHGTYWSLGGFESPRMQTARYRGLRDGMWPEWKTFATADSNSWKSDPTIAKLYSHSAGISHVFLDKLGPKAKQAYVRSLVGLYQSENQSDQLLPFLGSSSEEAKQSFQDWLVVDDVDLENLFADPLPPIQDLVLTASQLKTTNWQRLQVLDRLEWLEVSFSNVQDEDLNWLATKTEGRQLGQSIKRISVEGTAITQKLIARIAQLPNLEELDVSLCPNVDDSALESLRNHPKLKILWLTKTKVTERCLPILKSLKNLATCDIQGTKISDAAWRKFASAHPRLNQ